MLQKTSAFLAHTSYCILLENKIEIKNLEKSINSAKEKILRDNQLREEVEGSAYYYESYVTYKNKPFASETLNVGQDGCLRNTMQHNIESSRKAKDYVDFRFIACVWTD